MASSTIIAQGAGSVKEFNPLAFQTEFESLIRAIPYDGVADKLRHTLAEEIRGGVLSDGNFAAGTRTKGGTRAQGRRTGGLQDFAW